MIQSNKFLILSVITVLAVIAAVIISDRNSPVTSLEKELLFSDLKEKINDVARIKIQGKEDSIRLVRENEKWSVQEADNYPANFGKVRQIAIALSELEIDSAKTKNPENYSKLGVEDPESDGAESRLLTVVNGENRILVSLIVGKERLSSSSSENPGLYVRLPEQQQALLVNGDLDVSTNIVDWIDADLMNIEPKRIRQVSVTQLDGSTVSLTRNKDEDNFLLEDIPEGKEIKSEYTLNRQEDMLALLKIDGVRSEQAFSFPDESVVTSVETYDGLNVLINSISRDNKYYAKFIFTFSSPGYEAEETNLIETEVEELVTKTSGWIYEIPGYKNELIIRKLDDLVADIEAEEGPEELMQ
jgi:hypothetical protein